MTGRLFFDRKSNYPLSPEYQGTVLNLFPQPRKVIYKGRHTNLAGRSHIWIDTQASHRLRKRILAASNLLPGLLQVSSVNTSKDDLFLHILPLDSSYKRQQYTLTISDQGVSLVGGSEEGVHYGLQTLVQLIAEHRFELPLCRIEDHPDLENRGYFLDVSRCKVPSMQTIYNIVDGLVALKINQFQLYIEHTFAFANHPLVWQDASPFTASEILELDAYCKDRFIELVPNLNSFGHFERWLRYPEYHQYAECPDGFEHPFGGSRRFGSTLKPNKFSLQLLNELYTEYLPNFSSSQFNIGGDEPWELGQGWSRKRCEKEGTSRVYLDFLAKINRLVGRHNRKMMFWGDIVLQEPANLDLIPDQSTAMIWGYEADHPFRKQCQLLADLNLPFYVCPGTSSWNTLTGRSANTLLNLKNAARQALKFGANGYLITDWGDHGHHQYLPITYPGLLLGACYSWCFKANTDVDPARGINRIFFEDDDGDTGHLCWQLGKVLELAPAKLRNATIFNQLLFWQMDQQPDFMKELRTEDLQHCLDAFDQLDAQLPQCNGNAADANLVRQELGNAIRMAKHGINRYLLYKGEINDVSKVRRELQAIIPLHEELWLSRNRRGGLYESSSHLRRSLKPLQD
jgi:hypothetical protein